MESAKILEYKSDPNKFDLITHRWNSQGHLTHVNPYRLFILSGVSYYERPVNSGNLWHENNQPAGRVECEFGPDGKIAKKEFKFGAAHRDWKAPLSGDEKLHFELEQEKAKTADLQAELEAIRKEQKVKQAVAPSVEKKPDTVAEVKQVPPTLTKKVTP